MAVKLNFSAEEKQDDKLNFLEPGEYDARLSKLEYKKSKAGNDMYVAHWAITTEGISAWPLRDYYVVAPNSLWKWRILLEAANIDVGADEDIELDDDDINELIGLEVTLTLEEDKPFTNDKGEVYRKNKITAING